MHGKWDREVKKIFGVKIWDALMAEVSKGALNAQHVKDISALLNDHVGGNHLRRMESDNCSCDTAEWRYILSDWYNQKMFYYDSCEHVSGGFQSSLS